MKKTLLALVAALGAAGSCGASEWSPFLGGGLTAGGDQVATATYVTGRTQKLHAGGLIDLRAGLDYRLEGSDISLQGAIAYQTDRSNADNGHIDFTRFPLELLALWHPNERWSVGGGVRKALSAKYDGSGAGTDFGPDQSYKSSVGFILEGEYAITPKVGLKARYVHEDYTPKGGGDKLDGSHVGILGVYYFR